MAPNVTVNLRPIPILMYHQIAVAPADAGLHRSLYVPPIEFSRQMTFLRYMGYRGLSMTALQPYLRGEKQGRVVGITLDDGYLNNLTHALPVLERNGFTSTCYVVSQLIGKTNAWDREAGVPQTLLMDAPQLREWVAAGQDVGAHTRHHVRLKNIGVDRSLEEIALCKSELEETTDAPVNHFCYPYGGYELQHRDIAQAAGFQTATNSRRSRCHLNEDMMQLPRLPVVHSTNLPSFLFKVATPHEDPRRTLSLWHKATNAIKGLRQTEEV